MFIIFFIMLHHCIVHHFPPFSVRFPSFFIHAPPISSNFLIRCLLGSQLSGLHPFGKGGRGRGDRPSLGRNDGFGTGNEPNGTDAKICLSVFSLVLTSDWQRCPILFSKVGVRERLFKGLDVYDDYFFDRDMVKMMNNCHSQLQYGSIVDCFSLKKSGHMIRHGRYNVDSK